MAYTKKENEWADLGLPCHRHNGKCGFSTYKEYDDKSICEQCPCAYFDKTRFEAFKEWMFKKSISKRKIKLRVICNENIDKILSKFKLV